MPLFSRPDGIQIKNLSLVRRMLPFMMPSRNESVVYYEEVMDMTAALAFVDKWNAEHAPELKITVFNVLLASFARALVTRPGMDRFVAGGHVYQRKQTHISFTVKKQFDDDAPIVTAKLEIKKDEPFADMVARIRSLITESRDDTEKPVDKELKILLRIPPVLLHLFVWLARVLDGMNLYPRFMMENDPMYASMFVANLGSLGIDRIYHHLYEYGTISLFGAVGQVAKAVVPGPDDKPVVKPILPMRWSFDERVNDGFYAVESLAIARRHVEKPDLLLGPWPEVQLPGRKHHRERVAGVSTPKE
jgi:pyruvate/2-oxoglutarate dehydrogenase complex dihydrolipoamide acyltransferase (E2) component